MTTVPPDEDPEGEPDWVKGAFGATMLLGAYAYARFRGWLT